MGELATINPPTEPVSSKQYDLFTTFFGDPKDLSNTLELWDAIPIYGISRRAQNKLRNSDGRLKIKEHHFEIKRRFADEPIKARMKLSPAMIEDENGNIKDYYPSYTEQLVEEVLKKIFADQRYGLHIPREGQSWVRFTAHMIRKELKEQGHTRSLQEIFLALEIMSKCHLEVALEGRGRGLIYKNPILTNIASVTREDLSIDPNARWMLQLPVLISKGVDELAYRQFVYSRHMQMSQLAMWLHKRLVHRYRNASLFTPYHFSFNTIERDSLALHHTRKTRNIQTVRAALDELKERDIIASWEEKEKRNGRAIEDVVFTVFASVTFTDDSKASLGRAKKAEAAAIQRR